MTNWNKLNLPGLVVCAALAVGGCKDDKPAVETSQGGNPPAATSTSAGAHKDDHDHDHEHDKDGHHAGPKHDLGKQTAAGHSITVTQIGDAVVAGKAVTFEIKLAPDAAGAAAAPKAVRAWVGTENAEGSLKAKAPWREEGKFYDADLEVPAKLPDGSKLWVEVENDAGKHKASFAYKTK